MQNRAEGGGGAEGGPGTAFEAGLRRHAFRAPPSEWRAAILNGAVAGTGMGAESGESRRARACEGGGRAWIPWWSGWGTVAAAWLLIVGLNRFATVDVAADRTERAPFSPRTLAFIAEQQRAALGSWAGSGAEPGGDRAPAAEGRAPGGVPRADRTRERERGMGDRKLNFLMG